jgi:hypothetical protein
MKNAGLNMKNMSPNELKNRKLLRPVVILEKKLLHPSRQIDSCEFECHYGLTSIQFPKGCKKDSFT